MNPFRGQDPTGLYLPPRQGKDVMRYIIDAQHRWAEQEGGRMPETLYLTPQDWDAAVKTFNGALPGTSEAGGEMRLLGMRVRPGDLRYRIELNEYQSIHDVRSINSYSPPWISATPKQPNKALLLL